MKINKTILRIKQLDTNKDLDLIWPMPGFERSRYTAFDISVPSLSLPNVQSMIPYPPKASQDEEFMPHFSDAFTNRNMINGNIVGWACKER